MTGHTDMQIDIQHAEAIAGTATKATLGGASGAVVFGLTATEIGAYCAIVSMCVTVVGACFKVYFDWQAHKMKMRDGA